MGSAYHCSHCYPSYSSYPSYPSYPQLPLLHPLLLLLFLLLLQQINLNLRRDIRRPRTHATVDAFLIDFNVSNTNDERTQGSHCVAKAVEAVKNLAAAMVSMEVPSTRSNRVRIRVSGINFLIRITSFYLTKTFSFLIRTLFLLIPIGFRTLPQQPALVSI